jgi:hypothetical protein
MYEEVRDDPVQEMHHRELLEQAEAALEDAKEQVANAEDVEDSDEAETGKEDGRAVTSSVEVGKKTEDDGGNNGRGANEK